MSTDSKTELEEAIRRYIADIGEDPDREGLKETPKRFVKQFTECVVGYKDDPSKHLKIFDSEGSEELITVADITFSSLCEHHLVPFFGMVNIAYIPNGKILGLSKFARIVDAYSKRLQVQERLTKQIADIIEENLKPKFCIVSIEAKHTCMSSRGVKRNTSFTRTTSIKGDEKKYKLYAEEFMMRSSK